MISRVQFLAWLASAAGLSALATRAASVSPIVAEKKFLVIGKSSTGEVRLLHNQGTLFAGEEMLGVLIVRGDIATRYEENPSPRYVPPLPLYQFSPFKGQS